MPYTLRPTPYTLRLAPCASTYGPLPFQKNFQKRLHLRNLQTTFVLITPILWQFRYLQDTRLTFLHPNSQITSFVLKVSASLFNSFSNNYVSSGVSNTLQSCTLSEFFLLPLNFLISAFHVITNSETYKNEKEFLLVIAVCRASIGQHSLFSTNGGKFQRPSICNAWWSKEASAKSLLDIQRVWNQCEQLGAGHWRRRGNGFSE